LATTLTRAQARRVCSDRVGQGGQPGHPQVANIDQSSRLASQVAGCQQNRMALDTVSTTLESTLDSHLSMAESEGDF
jgi:hypothetical protein